MPHASIRRCRVSQEGGQAVWCVSFNFVTPEHHDIFAAVCSNKVRCRVRLCMHVHILLSCSLGSRAAGAQQATVYQCLPDGGIQVVQVYADDDVSRQAVLCDAETARVSACSTFAFAAVSTA